MTIKKIFEIEKPVKKDWLKLDLQTFADETPPGDVTPPGDETPPADVTLSQADLDKKIEAEADRKLASALEKKQAEWQASQQEAINKALEEKERLSKLSEKERQDEELTQREKDIAARESEIAHKELKADAVADLTEKELPASFADILIGKDAEKTLANINEFKTAFDEAVAQKVKESLRQETPGAGGTGASKLGNLGKQIAEMNKANNTKSQESQDLYFK